MSDFKIGDVVILNSGGPSMTVTSVSDKSVSVRWFKADATYFDDVFDNNTIKLANNP
jgi:uncharacterized protein YodC (DUF2158 family)